MDRNDLWITLDIVIAVYNEQECLDLLFKRLESVFSSLNLKKNFIGSVSYVMIDDGSVDQSAEIITSYIAQGIPAILYRLSRNFGHQNAVSAGLDYANADIVVIIDADLQDPPELILQMIGKWREGYDVVYGVRRKRKENFVRVSCYWLFYRLLAFLPFRHESRSGHTRFAGKAALSPWPAILGRLQPNRSGV
jgi:glycosyltransferase involved in cell wall biosynthesis